MSNPVSSWASELEKLTFFAKGYCLILVVRKAMRFISVVTLTFCGMLGGFLQIPLETSVSFAQEQHLNLTGITVDEWVTEWMKGTKAVSGSLNLRRFKDPYWIMLNDIDWKPELGQASLPKVTVPKGFVTDLASIPPIFFSVLRPDGEYAYAAIIHDYLYWTQVVPREDADMVFRLAMEEFEVNPAVAFLIYKAVRWGGQFAWNSNAEKKSNGEKRILRRFPQNPKTRWTDWKTRPNVFAE